jgi:hypothetical protein
MTIATYSELVSEMGDWLNRSDLTTKIPTFIRLFEARMNRRLRAPDMEQSFSFTTVAGTSTYSINSRVRELRELYLTTDDSATPPVDYTVSGETIVFDPVPTAAFSVTYRVILLWLGWTRATPRTGCLTIILTLICSARCAWPLRISKTMTA